jgi:exosortase/archaeosortase family protein
LQKKHAMPKEKNQALKAQIKKYYAQNRTIILFLLRVAIIYFAWKAFSWFIGEESTPIEERYWPWLSNIWEHFNDFVRIGLLKSTQIWFNLVGLESEIINNYRIWVYGYAVVGVGNYCIGIQLWVFFVALICSYSGKWQNKLWFSLLGVFLINILNIFRLIGVTYAAHYYPEHIQFNHDYVFNGIVYVFTFLMWMWWVKKFSR